MAQLASERLNRGEDAVRLYRDVLSADPGRLDVLDALERHAERAKDWTSLADALERRAQVLKDDAARLVVLQKLGTVYAEHSNDPKAAARAWRRVLELQPGHQQAHCACCETPAWRAATTTASPSFTPRKATSRAWRRC